ncbi:MAG TPA: NnrS family protein [Candidatus Binatia bacterium]|jgi:uncharacterized protein involved in response to NO
MTAAEPNLSNVPPGASGGPVLFALGFRPFFLLAAIFAIVTMGDWLYLYLGGGEVESYYGGIDRHPHEMIFGYTAAILAGFLLTAVRNWTNIMTASGASLAALAGLWLAGRVAPFFPRALPPILIALVDLAFLPALAGALAVPLIRSRQRNLIFIPILLALAAANLLVHLQESGYAAATARPGTFLGLDLIVLIIVVVGGRVIPFFTERALAGANVRRRTVIEWLAPLSALAFAIADLASPNSPVAGACAALAAIVNGARLLGWHDRRVWRMPLLWVLHLGYGWIVVGFFLRTLAAFGAAAPEYTIHAFTVGGIGVLTLGMMARVSLGHTGRPLEAAAPMALAFVLINLAALVRGILPIVAPEFFSQLIALSGALWIAAFALFIAVYAPILTAPRIDGQPG